MRREHAFSELIDDLVNQRVVALWTEIKWVTTEDEYSKKYVHIDSTHTENLIKFIKTVHDTLGETKND